MKCSFFLLSVTIVLLTIVEGKKSVYHVLVKRQVSDWLPKIPEIPKGFLPKIPEIPKGVLPKIPEIPKGVLPKIPKIPNTLTEIGELFCPPVCVDFDNVFNQLSGVVLTKLKSMCETSLSNCQTVSKVLTDFKSYPTNIFKKNGSICTKDPSTCAFLGTIMTPLGAIPVSVLSKALELCDGSIKTCIDLITNLFIKADGETSANQPNQPDMDPTFSFPTNTTVKQLHHDLPGLTDVMQVPTTQPIRKKGNYSVSHNSANHTHSLVLLCVYSILIGYLVFKD